MNKNLILAIIALKEDEVTRQMFQTQQLRSFC